MNLIPTSKQKTTTTIKQKPNWNKQRKGLLVGEELREALSEESGGVGDEEGVVREENGAVEGVKGGDPRGVIAGVSARASYRRRRRRR